MTNRDFLNAMNDISDSYLLEVEEPIVANQNHQAPQWRKYVSIAASFVLIFAFLIGIVTNQPSVDPTTPEETFGGQAIDLTKVYSSDEEKVKDTSVVLIVQGKVTESKEQEYNGTNYTISKVKVKDTLKGQIPTQEVTVCEYGTATSPVMSYSVMEPNDSVFLFLETADKDLADGLSVNSLYAITGGVQGKFVKSGFKYVSATPTTIQPTVSKYTKKELKTFIQDNLD